MKFLFALAIFSILSGCAFPGSPVHTSNLSEAELKEVDVYTLCEAATSRELYVPGINVIREVRRRGLNCRNIYTYTPQPQKVLGQQPQQQPPMMQNPSACIQDGGSVYCPGHPNSKLIGPRY
ncbi:hypothetical protein [Limnohabitans sp.]|uniref:hypothetical protein n=1 Tax=Limnohabitans sp. TaxID=1907725 RepID=UPI0038BD7A20